MKESFVEARLRTALESYGFKVLKLVTPGHNGIMDRMILRPVWSPGAPWFVECKRPGAKERRLQELVREEMRSRGCQVLDVCDSYERVEHIVMHLMAVCNSERTDQMATLNSLKIV